MTVSPVHDRLVFYPGDMVFAEGEEGNWAYLIQSGKIEIFRTLPNGEEHILNTLGPGRLFGEMALLDSEPRMASARAVGLTTLVLINNEILQRNLEKTHPLIIELIRSLSSNLRSMTRQYIKKVCPAADSPPAKPQGKQR